MTGTESNRRPIAARGSAWARRFATALARSAVTPNQISGASIVFAAIGAALLIEWPSAAGLVLCALCIQLRLICNLLDGMRCIIGRTRITASWIGFVEAVRMVAEPT